MAYGKSGGSMSHGGGMRKAADHKVGSSKAGANLYATKTGQSGMGFDMSTNSKFGYKMKTLEVGY